MPQPQIQFLFVKLRKQLDQHKGKKVYGYLSKPIKATVNEIVAQLSAEPAIEEFYKEWNKINREKLSLYFESKDPSVPLADNKEFRSIKNIIIKAVMELPPEVEIAHSAVSKKDIEDAPIQLRPRFYEEEAEMAPPVSSIPPKIVTHPVETVAPHTMAAAKGIISSLARLIGDKCMAHRQSLQRQIDQKLQSKINEKKQAMGLKTERTQKASYQTEETYEMSM